MKIKYISLIIALVVSSFVSYGQQVYFNQDFNSSSDIKDYYGNPVTADKFNSIATTGSGQADIVNNKLQFIKTDGSGNNRVGFVRSSNLAGAPGSGAGFLKISMEITISGNVADVPSGFRFTMGEVSGAPSAPGDANTHSNIYINPTENAGEFKIAGAENISEDAFSGTKTVIWYINNSGTPVGYTDPAGQISTLEDDAADVWVVDGSSAVLAIDEEPATTPDIRLRNFKLSSNPNFTATMDMDDIVMSEEKVVFVPKIVSVASVPSVTVPLKTSFDLIPFVQEVEVTYDDNTTGVAGISWAPTTNYNRYFIGTYNATGTLIPVNGTINPQGLTVNADVTVIEDMVITNAFSPNNDGKNDTWLIPDLQRYSVTSVEVFDRRGNLLFQSSDPLLGWDGRNAEGDVLAGSYFYVVKVPALSMEKKGVLTVIK